VAVIGLMGGTFDPPHLGHLILAEQAWEQFGLDKVLFVTAADPPHKRNQAVTEVRRRLEMTRLAINNNEHFECSTLEIERPGPSYTIDTVEKIVGMYGPESRVYVLVGADEASQLMSWREPYRIQELATIAVASRAYAYHTGWDVLVGLPKDFSEKLALVKMPGIDISSTDLRERVRSGRSIRYLVPRSVEDYILDNNLYRGKE